MQAKPTCLGETNISGVACFPFRRGYYRLGVQKLLSCLTTGKFNKLTAMLVQST